MTNIWPKHVLYQGDDRGFTLTEVMISIVVFSVGLLGIAQSLVVVINTNLTARQITTATRPTARDRKSRIDILRMLSYRSDLRQ